MQRSTCSRFNFTEPLVKNVKTDTTCQPTLQRRLGVTMYGGSCVFDLVQTESCIIRKRKKRI